MHQHWSVGISLARPSHTDWEFFSMHIEDFCAWAGYKRSLHRACFMREHWGQFSLLKVPRDKTQSRFNKRSDLEQHGLSPYVGGEHAWSVYVHVALMSDSGLLWRQLKST